MVLPGHLAGSYIATHVILSLSGSSFSVNELTALYVVGILAGDLPDLDLFWFYFENRNVSFPRRALPKPLAKEGRRESSVESQSNVSGITLDSRWSLSSEGTVNDTRRSKVQNHRDHITHAPIFWLFTSLVIFDIGYNTNSSFITTTAFLVLAGSWTHLLLDSIEFGIRWLWPFSKKRFCLINMKIPDQSASKYQIGSIAYYWEFLVNSYLKEVSFYMEVLIVVVAVVVFLSL